MISNSNILISFREVVDQIKDGDLVGIGGWGTRRKPMALVREIAKSELKNLSIVAFGGPDVDMLIGAGKVRQLLYAYVFFEGGSSPVPRNYRRAREEGQCEFIEYSEYALVAALEAGAKRLPFYPARSGLGSGLLDINKKMKTFKEPFSNSELVAIEGITPDVSLIHVSVASPEGFAQVYDNFNIDDYFIKASKKVFLCADKIASREFLAKKPEDTKVLSIQVDGVVHAPFGAHFTSAYPQYSLDREHIDAYIEASQDPNRFQDYLNKYVFEPEDQISYLEAIGGIRKILSIWRG